MSYSGSKIARSAREELGKALASLQQDPNTPPDVMNLTQNVAQAVGALFEAEKATDERAGKAAIRTALGLLSQTMALLQEVRTDHKGVASSTSAFAAAMGKLHPLTVVPSMGPPGAPGVPAFPSGPRVDIEANVGATSETNFYVGFSGEVSEGGVFIATYNTLAVGTAVAIAVSLPGGFEFKVPGRVHFVRDPMDMMADSEPGMGVRFEGLSGANRELVLRFIQKRAPMFYDD